MYGYEAATGLGGLAARAPANPYFAQALTIRDPGSMVVGEPATRGGAPGMAVGSMGGQGGIVSAGGGAVIQNPANQLGSWREILDWHNSPAPWILLLLLLVYGYVHVSYRRGRVSAGGGL